MTIPIRPGPFSFLATLGQAGGAATQQAEEQRRQNQKEDWQTLDFIFKAAKLRSDPSFLTTPQAMGVYKRLGLAAPDTAPTTDEAQTAIMRRFVAPHETPGFNVPLSGLISGAQDVQVKPTGQNVSAGERMFAGLPAKSAIAQEEQLAPQKLRTDIAQTQLAGTQATAALPGAAATTVAQQQNLQDQQYNDVAWRYVTDLYAENKGRLPTPSEAYKLASKDPNAVGVTQAHIGEAVTKLNFMLKDQNIKELMASARYMGAAGVGLDDLARINNQQMGIYAQMLKDTRSRMGVQDNDSQLAQMAANQRQMGIAVSAPLAQAEERWNNYVTEAGRILNDINSLGQKTTGVVSPAMGIPAPPPTAGGDLATRKGQARQEYNARARGVTDPARRKAIAQEIATKYGVPLENK